MKLGNTIHLQYNSCHENNNLQCWLFGKKKSEKSKIINLVYLHLRFNFYSTVHLKSWYDKEHMYKIVVKQISVCCQRYLCNNIRHTELMSQITADAFPPTTKTKHHHDFILRMLCKTRLRCATESMPRSLSVMDSTKRNWSQSWSRKLGMYCGSPRLSSHSLMLPGLASFSYLGLSHCCKTNRKNTL